MPGAEIPNPLTFRIGELGVCVSSDIPWSRLLLEDHYRPFLLAASPDISVDAHYSIIPPIRLPDAGMIFQATENFKMYAAGRERIMALSSGRPDVPIFCLARFDDAYRAGEVFFSLDYLLQAFGERFPHPLFHPLFRTLIVSRLAMGIGLLVHGCGIDAGGRGFLFAASSNRGKTTMARLWESTGSGTVLNDERIVLREREGRLWIFGTPWHGELPHVSPNGVPLEKIFFPDHAPSNAIRARAGAAAAAALLSHSYQPVWDRAGLEFALEFGRRVVSEVPCFNLGFVPDGSVVDFVRCGE